MEPVARHGALLLRRGASARRRRRPGRRAVRRVVHRWPPRWPTPIRSSISEAELALLAMDRGRWAEAAEHVELALAAIDEHRMHDYATSVLAFAAAARLAVHRGDLKEADRQLTRAMRARPSCTFVLPFLAVRRAAAARQGALDHAATTRPLVTCCVRSTTSCSTGRLSAPSSTRSRSFAGLLTSSTQAEPPAASPLTPGGASAAAVPADAPHDPRDRRAAVRLPQHRQHRGRLDLPETRCLVPQRRGGPGDDDRAARRVADLTRRVGVPGRRRGRTRAPAPASAPPRPRTGAPRRE